MDEDITHEQGPAPLEPTSPPVSADLTEAGEPLPAPRKRGWPVFAWLVIILLTLFTALAQVRRKETNEGVAAESRMGLILVELQGRALVGEARFPLLKQESQKVYQQVKALNTGPVRQRLCFIVLAGELAGPREALKQFGDLQQKVAKDGVKLSPTDEQIERILRRIYQARENGKEAALRPAERALLRQQLGWFGELALAPEGGPPEERANVLESAERTFLVLFSAALFVTFVGLAGLAALILMLILLFLGKLRGGLRGGSVHGGVYAETFALWMLLFIGLNVAVDFLPEAIPRMPALGATQLLSLVILVWPVLRGIPWRQVRADIGWTAGRKPLLEPLLGVSCYGMAFPLLAVGFAIMLALMALQHLLSAGGPGTDNFGPSGAPAHPFFVTVATGDWWTRLQIVLLAAVFAPIVEETMFRGVLYRHLREATHRARAVWSVLFSATVVSFLFAVVHPQGLIAVPPLMALSIAFCLTREWRETLIPSMVAHGINNGLLMIGLMLALGD